MGKQGLSVEGKGQIFHIHHVVAAPLAGAETKVDGGEHGVRFYQRLFQTGNDFQLAFRSADVLFPVPLALLGHNALQPLDFPHGVVVFPLNGEGVFLFLFQMPGVVALVQGQPLVLHFKSPVSHVVQKETVVGNHQIRAGEAFQKVFQPFHRLDVQMVGGFVQQQQVCAAEEHFGKL